MKRLALQIIVFTLVAVIYLAGGLEFVEHRLMDLRFSLTRGTASGDLVLGTIDPESLRSLDVWPWARGYHATVLENLVTAGASTVGFDVDFSSRSHPQEDAGLERALAEAPIDVVLPSFQQSSKADGPDPVTTRPLSTFGRHARAATINVQPDTGGLVRRYRATSRSESQDAASFAAVLAGSDQWHNEDFYIDFGIDPATIPRISYVHLLTGQFDPQLVKGKIVLIGATAVELGDQIPVPVLGSIPGPVLQAMAFESLVQGRTLERVHRGAILALVLLVTVVLGLLMDGASWKWGLLFVALTCAATFGISLITQHLTPLMLDVSPIMLAAIGSFVGSISREVDRQRLTLLLQNVDLQRTESLMHRVFDSSFDAIVVFDESNSIRMFNTAAQKMFGCSVEDALGMPLQQFVSLGLNRTDGDETNVSETGAGGPREVVGRRCDGTTLSLEISISELENDESRLSVGILRDVGERKNQQRAVEYRLTHDPLTDLPNRALLQKRFTDTLWESRQNGWSVSILLLDLDGFREINDALGHHIGDQLLKQIGGRLRDKVRTSDLVSRLGGDEFAVLLPQTDLAAAKKVADSLCDHMVERFQLRGLSLQVAASIGVTSFPEHGLDAAELMQRADVAMYTAKRKRTGISVYDPEQDFSSVRNLTLNGDLGRAIEENGLLLLYQPKVDIQTARIIGVEALIRWNHPTHGMIRPDEFIRLAEHGGLITPLTRWILDEALRQNASWRAMGLKIATSVNLSARNLEEQDLPQAIDALLKRYQIPPDGLILEITESVLMDNPERAIDLLSQLTALGLQISIDDFGTGYSSLAYLKRLPAKEVKIDRSFVQSVDRDPVDAVIVQSTINMAHALNRKVCAEGVEKPEVWEQLKLFGCDIGQGYLWGKPMPAEEIDARARAARRQMAKTAVSARPQPVTVSRGE